MAINFPTPDLEGREISLGDDVMGLREELSKRQEQFAKYFVTAMACGAVSVALLIGACVFHLIEEKAVNTVYLIAASIIGGAGLVFAILSAIYYRPLSATFSQMQEKYNSHTGAGTTDIELG